VIGGHEVIEVAHGEQALGEGVGSAHGWLVCLVGGGLDCRGWAAVADCRWGVFQQPVSGRIAYKLPYYRDLAKVSASDK
jgi:hypothetical protein